ncbi:inorganic diphosphatase [Patescibacteria group bacterium]|nr:inorganic diphosphatase [Patescibacteria group bacterium]
MSSNIFHELPIHDKSPENAYMIVENPRGYHGKIEFNKKFGVLMLDRATYAPMPYPIEYGLIPRSWNKHDDDPMDIMCLSSQHTYPGVVLDVRILGMLKMDDSGEIDHKIFGVVSDDPLYNDIDNLSQIDKHKIKEIEFYFGNYKELMKDKYVKVLGWGDKNEAVEFLEETFEEYKRKFGDKGGDN